MRKSILILATLLSGLLICSATVTPYSWYHTAEGGGTNPDRTDSSGNNHPYNAGFSCQGSGNEAALIMLSGFGVGGPLGKTGWTSTGCTRFGYFGCGAAGTWIQGSGSTVPTTAQFSLPPTNWLMECWVLPVGTSSGSGGGSSQFMSTGSGQFGGRPGGVAFRTTYNGGDDTVSIGAYAIGPQGTNNFRIGDLAISDKTRWIHVAVVNDNGVTTFYVNGVANGASESNVTAPSGVPYFGSGQDTGGAYNGYLDEARFATFAPGQFDVSDLLTRPPGPSIIAQPQSTTALVGGTAPFRITVVLDPDATYQWRRGGLNIPSGTDSQYVLPAVSMGDSGALFDCVVTSSGISVTSLTAVLTVAASNPDTVAAYRAAVQSESSLLAYFPADNDTGTTLTNVKDSGHNGTLELNAILDGRTNGAFGQKAVSFYSDGDVTIPNNPAFEFSSGNGTIEAIVYMAPTPLLIPNANSNPKITPTIFSEATDGTGAIYYALRASADGANLLYVNSSTAQQIWLVAGGTLTGRVSHVAMVFDHLTNVTAYVNGQNLGTRTQPGFGSAAAGAPAWIGSVGTTVTNNRWWGAVDELAIYGSALSESAIQTHYSKYISGTNISPPTIISQSASKTLLAGGSPFLTIKAGGTLPLDYQWKSNDVPITGATSSTLVIPNITQTATYTVSVSNPAGSTNAQPMVLTVASPPAGYASTVMSAHPRAYFRLNETSGTVAADSAGFNDATYIGSMTKGVGGIVVSDPAVNLTGGRAEAPWSSAVNPAGPFSVECFAMPNGTTARAVVSSQNRTNSRAGYTLYAYSGGAFWRTELGILGSTTANTLSGTTAPQTNIWSHVVFTYDGTTNADAAKLYVNGTVEASAAIAYGTQFQPNTIAPFEIGCRSDLGNVFNGRVDEVAIYDYALSRTQVTNHWSYLWVAAAITQNPGGVTNAEGSTVTLTATASGLPNTYQWFKDGTPLTAANNFDGTAHYPAVITGGIPVQGVTGPTLVIAEAVPADSGLYHLVVSNPVGGSQTIDAQVLITADTNPPVVRSVQGLGTPNMYGGPTPFVVKVVFDKRIDPVTGGTRENYTFNPTVTVSSALVRGDAQAPTLGTDWKTVFLQTSGLTPGQQYTLTVNGVKSQAQTGVPIVPKAVSFWAPPLQQGVLWWDYYYQVANGTANLQSDTNFPYAPATNSYTTAFDTTQITGGDLNNNPAFGALGDNYGCSLAGWITPTVSGDYTFFVASDDASELDLNPYGPEPNGAFPIAVEAGCCNGFLEPGAAQTSAAYTLSAGVSYFIRALETEGGGGDYVKVAWRISTDSTPAASLTPIPSTYLSSYVLLPPTFNPAVFSNGQLTISWTGYQTTLLQSTNVALPISEWTPVPGNSPYHVTPATTGQAQMYYRLTQ